MTIVQPSTSFDLPYVQPQSAGLAIPGHSSVSSQQLQELVQGEPAYCGSRRSSPVSRAAALVENEATTVIGNGAEQWFTGDAYTTKRLDDSLGEHGGIPFEPGSPTGWAAGVSDEDLLAD
jgi:hypothetical protein